MLNSAKIIPTVAGNALFPKHKGGGGGGGGGASLDNVVMEGWC